MHKFGDCSFCGGEVKNDIVELDYRYKGELYSFRMFLLEFVNNVGKNILFEKYRKK